MLRRYPDAIRTFVTVLNFIMRMRQYHTRSYQYDQVLPSLHLACSMLSIIHLDQQNSRSYVRPVRCV